MEKSNYAMCIFCQLLVPDIKQECRHCGGTGNTYAQIESIDDSFSYLQVNILVEDIINYEKDFNSNKNKDSARRLLDTYIRFLEEFCIYGKGYFKTLLKSNNSKDINKAFSDKMLEIKDKVINISKSFNMEFY